MVSWIEHLKSHQKRRQYSIQDSPNSRENLGCFFPIKSQAYYSNKRKIMDFSCSFCFCENVTDLCTICKSVYYCSEKCKLNDKERHKSYCDTKKQELAIKTKSLVEKFSSPKTHNFLTSYTHFMNYTAVCKVKENSDGGLRCEMTNNPSKLFRSLPGKINTELRVYLDDYSGDFLSGTIAEIFVKEKFENILKEENRGAIFIIHIDKDIKVEIIKDDKSVFHII